MGVPDGPCLKPSLAWGQQAPGGLCEPTDVVHMSLWSSGSGLSVPSTSRMGVYRVHRCPLALYAQRPALLVSSRERGHRAKDIVFVQVLL